MAGNQIIAAVLPAVLTVVVVWLVIRALRPPKRPRKTHEPPKPGAGYDPKAVVRSKGAGMADGGMGSAPPGHDPCH